MIFPSEWGMYIVRKDLLCEGWGMLSFFSDIFNAFKQSSLERVRSPVLGAFVFSWFGFNWQILVVLFMGKNDVFKKIEYINSHFSIKELLIAPIFTTALISILLPCANMLVARIQRGNNLKFNTISLQAKKDIASDQLQIAQFEAKKKLAEEKERRYIEKGIETILEKNEALDKELVARGNVINELNADLQSVRLEIARNVENLRNFEERSEQLKSDKELLVKKLNDSESKYLMQSRTLEDTQRELIRLNEDISKERAEYKVMQRQYILAAAKNMELTNAKKFARGDVIGYKDKIKVALERMSDNMPYAIRELSDLASEMEEKWGTLEDILQEMNAPAEDKEID